MPPRKKHIYVPPERPLPDQAPAFFVPHASDPDAAETVWNGVVAFMRSQGLETTGERIYAAKYTHEGKHCLDIVGGPDRYNGETVLAILRTRSPGPLLICTANRGVLRGGPIFGPGDAQIRTFLAKVSDVGSG